MRRILSNPESEAPESLDPSRLKWDCQASGMEISTRMSPSPLFQMGKVEFTLSFTISLPKPTANPTSIDWDLLIKFSSDETTDSDSSPNLKDAVQFLKTISDIQSEIGILISKVRNLIVLNFGRIK